jgi:hypothetical protein
MTIHHKANLNFYQWSLGGNAFSEGDDGKNIDPAVAALGGEDTNG